jgi:hypothetical protein
VHAVLLSSYLFHRNSTDRLSFRHQQYITGKRVKQAHKVRSGFRAIMEKSYSIWKNHLPDAIIFLLSAEWARTRPAARGALNAVTGMREKGTAAKKET